MKRMQSIGRMQITGLALAVVLVAAAMVSAGEKASECPRQTVCPVMGGEIDKDVFTDFEGKRVYFCCPMCIDKFKADPAKFLKKLTDEGVVLEDSPKGKEPCGGAHHGKHGHEGHDD